MDCCTERRELDTLAELFDIVTEMHEHRNDPSVHNVKDINDVANTANETVLAINVELAEVLNTFDWKPWRDRNKFPCQDTADELADVFVFYVRLCNTVGVSSSTLIRAIKAAVAKCETRLEEGIMTKGEL